MTRQNPPDELYDLAQRLGQRLSEAGHLLVTAESCTGGWVAQAVTEVPGSSAWFERGLVTYSNEAKCQLLAVNAVTLARFGAVSEAVVQEMVAGALANSRGHCALAVSGIAGPGGATVDKPVGTVCFAWQRYDSGCRTTTLRLDGDRHQVRRQAVAIALRGVLDAYA